MIEVPKSKACEHLGHKGNGRTEELVKEIRKENELKLISSWIV